ncbi:MAG: cysteine synthase A [Planctomycetes bacterium RBG_16_59_8]|nr:MAG: cysteine synthase A [Planctomycetes bacterium RBG_16_59_8]
MCANLIDTIGNTPLLHLKRLSAETDCAIYAKAEFMNPTGSIKDRIARHIVEQAEARGDLRKGSTILEVTSGNTGISFAMVGAEKGYRVVIMMPKSVSTERRKIIQSYGAELELLDDLLRIQQAMRASEERAQQDPTIFLPRQFSNPDNPDAHRRTTAREIVEQAGVEIDAFVMGVGTGGTLMGVASFLREVNPSVKIVAVEPAESAVMSGEAPGHHGIQGFADGFIPDIFNLKRIDKVVKVSTADAIAMAKRLARDEALFVGISSGANILASLQVARDLGCGKKIVTTLPDRGERYISIF